MISNKSAKIIIIASLVLFSVSVATTRAYEVNEQDQKQDQEQKEKKKVTFPEVSEEFLIVGNAKPYTLGNEDVLQIIVRNQPEFSGQFVIGPDGKIQYTFVGDIEAAGLTKDQLKERLEKELEKFVKVPEVSVAISAYNSKNVYVLGEVGRPGQYSMKGDIIPLRDAIVAAGLPTREAALRRVYIIKFASEKISYKKVDLFALLYKGSMKYNIELLPGEVVVVPSTVPSEINRALDTLLSPLYKAVVIDSFIERRR